MFGSRWFRLSALFAVLLTAFSLVAVGTAEARFGGSFGSRGFRTFQSVPATPTLPSITSPVQRSMGGTTYSPGYGAGGYGWGGYGYRPSLFGGFGGGLLSGFLFSGLFGMMFGGGWGGFGGFGGIFSLVIQLLLVGFVLRLLFRRFGWSNPLGAGYGGTGGYGGGYGPGGPQPWVPGGGYSPQPQAKFSRGRDEIGVTNADLNVFEQRLSQLQDAYSREDYDAMRRISTPEMMSYLTEELAQSAAKGLRNEVFDVKLLSGDIAEAWREGDREFATAALRYESRDVMRERATGQLVSGEDRVVERAEVWTFVRQRGGEWLLSAIQGA
jgi:predicted lipid-binding transport protein (Tim44 family)